MHKVHLMAKSLMIAIDIVLLVLAVTTCLPSKSFFSNISSFSNTWREYSRDYKKSNAQCHPEAPVKLANKIPPRCLKGRWGSATRFLEFWDLRPFAVIRDTFDHMFVSGPDAQSKRKRARHSTSGQPVDDLGAELEAEQHAEKLGKWRHNAMLIADCYALRVVVKVVLPFSNACNTCSLF